MAKQEDIKLQKFIAECGVCSRRKAEELIADELVKVNGKIAEIGQRIVPGKDRVKVRGKWLGTAPQKRMVLLMNKPKGVVCTNDDPGGQQTVFDLLPKDLQKMRFFCAGRLDKDSEGLMVITTDGAFANKLMHPSNVVTKRYQVTLQKPLKKQIVPKLLEGRDVDGDWLQFEKVFTQGEGEYEGVRLEVHIHHGKNREIRRLLESHGYYVKKLKRYQIGSYRMKKMPLGGIRILKDSEIELLFQ